MQWMVNLSSMLLLLLHISKSQSTTVINHTRAWTHTCKNGGYRYFTYLCPVVISYSIPVSEYWHKYPALNLSSISCSSALILTHIIKSNFNSAYCPCPIVTGTSDWQLLYVCRGCKKEVVFSLLFMYVCLS